MKSRQNPQCIFEKSRIISFKIFRKNFNCSQCEFAQTILNFSPLTKEPPERARMIKQLRNVIKNREEEAILKACQQGANMMTSWCDMNIPRDRFYHHAHVWFLPLSTRRFRLGLHEIAQLLLQAITGIQVSSDKSRGELHGTFVAWVEWST